VPQRVQYGHVEFEHERDALARTTYSGTKKCYNLIIILLHSVDLNLTSFNRVKGGIFYINQGSGL
jgi:hypothetical protein